METIEGNRLIAEFMGWESGRYSHLPNRLHRTDDKNVEWSTDINNLMYHSSWDWLMPVVEKIEKMKFGGHDTSVDINREWCRVNWWYNRSTDDYVKGSKIKRLWAAIIEFIKWYNTNKKPNE